MYFNVNNYLFPHIVGDQLFVYISRGNGTIISDQSKWGYQRLKLAGQSIKLYDGWPQSTAKVLIVSCDHQFLFKMAATSIFAGRPRTGTGSKLPANLDADGNEAEVEKTPNNFYLIVLGHTIFLFA